MRTVGVILKEERLRKGFTLLQVEKSTKIRAKFLEAIETEDYAKIPSFPYLQGFVKNYSTFLGLRTTTMLAILRREYTLKEKEKNKIIEEPLTKTYWQITPNKVIMLVVSILVFMLFSYFITQYIALHAPPPLLLEQPKEDLIVETEQIPVYGKTDADATLTINNEAVLVKDDGKFYKDVTLNVGTNTLVITSTSRVGEKTSTIRKITRT